MVDELDEDVLDVVDVVIKDAIDIVVEGILDDVVELEVVEDVMGAVNNGIYEVEDNGDVEVIVACVNEGVTHVLVDDDGCGSLQERNINNQSKIKQLTLPGANM